MKADNRYISYLDGFRGYAILLVIVSHLHLTKMNVAYLGVTLFFFVSGFLITKLLVYEFNKKSTISLRDFYLRRLYRLYPALIFMIVVSIVVMLINGYSIIWADVLAGLFYFTNYYLVYFMPQLQDANYLLVSRILWSLSVEEHFYLIFPLLFAGVFRSGSKRMLQLLTWLLVVFLAIRMIVFFQSTDPSRTFLITYYTTHCRADSILYGCVSALLLYAHDTKWYVRALSSRWSLVAGVALIAFSLLYTAPVFRYTFKYSFQGLGFFLLVPGYAYASVHGLVRKLVDNPISVYIGKLSYSLYLFHWVALKIGNLYWGEGSTTWYLVVVVITITLSLVSYYLIEMPFVAMRRKYGSNAHK
jgi:peptidoglycan/LPS O-acetylase OafA/YrhL